MKDNFFKYKVYGRLKGRKNKKKLDKNFFKNFEINLNNNLNINKKYILDIGSGNGESSLFLSNENPNKIIISSEVFVDGNINLINEIIKSKKKNIKLFMKNVFEIFDEKKLKNIFDEIWILFPDPWPKQRHQKRQMINNFFFKKIYPFIKSNGHVYIATDSSLYLNNILKIIYENKSIFKWINDKPEKWTYQLLNLPHTKYFKKAKKSNNFCFFIDLLKI